MRPQMAGLSIELEWSHCAQLDWWNKFKFWYIILIFYLFLFLEHAAHALITAGGTRCARASILIDRATEILGSKPR